MKKGSWIKVRKESVAAGSGVISAETMLAKVEYRSGDNVTVQSDDGFIYEIDANDRHDDGAYIIR